ncbi:coat protein [Rhizoctonia oryzae-sativae partitivirus 4]|nr:coat protein [Rhizoctonia oryzae-sativae partitivirus 4]
MTDRISVSAPTAEAGNPAVPTQAAPETRSMPNPPPAPAAKTFKKGVRKTGTFSAPALPGIPPLLQVVANAPSHIIDRSSPNMVIPSAINFFQSVSVLDQKMMTTKKFTDTTESWTPIITQWYACFIYTLQIFRTYNVSRIPDAAAIEFLQFIERSIDFTQIPVPGNWIPYLQSLTVVEAHHESFGNVHPVFPSIEAFNLDSLVAYSWPEHIRRLLPNPLLAIDQLVYYANWTGNQTNPKFVQFRNVFGEPISGSEVLTRTLVAPNCASWSYQSTGRQNVTHEFWVANRNLLPIRPNIQGTMSYNDYFKYFGFNNPNGTNASKWIDIVFSDMANYCQFVKGSVPLSTVPYVGIGAVIPRMIADPSTDLNDYVYPSIQELRDRRHLAGHRLFPNNLTYTLTHGDLTLEQIAEQYAMLTCVNTNLSRATVQNGWTQIDETNVREGPFWEVTDYKISRGINPTQGLQTNIPAYYHASTPVTPKTM